MYGYATIGDDDKNGEVVVTVVGKSYCRAVEGGVRCMVWVTLCERRVVYSACCGRVGEGIYMYLFGMRMYASECMGGGVPCNAW